MAGETVYVVTKLYLDGCWGIYGSLDSARESVHKMLRGTIKEFQDIDNSTVIYGQALHGLINRAVKPRPLVAGYKALAKGKLPWYTFLRVDNQDSVVVAKKVPPKFLLGNGGRIPKDIRESGAKPRKPVRSCSGVRNARQESSRGIR